MLETSVLLFPGAARRKRLALCLLLLAPGWAHAQTPGRLVIPRAARVDIGHTGIHTHANSIVFDTGTRDLAAMQADPVHFPHLTLRAHSRLPTDHAALPPDMAMPGDPPLDNPYGPMDGGATRPGWGVSPLHQEGRNGTVTNAARVVVPTRFAQLGGAPAARAAEGLFRSKAILAGGAVGCSRSSPVSQARHPPLGGKGSGLEEGPCLVSRSRG